MIISSKQVEYLCKKAVYESQEFKKFISKYSKKDYILDEDTLIDFVFTALISFEDAIEKVYNMNEFTREIVIGYIDKIFPPIAFDFIDEKLS